MIEKNPEFGKNVDTVIMGELQTLRQQLMLLQAQRAVPPGGPVNPQANQMVLSTPVVRPQ